MKGFGSAVLQAGALKEILSLTIAGGVENGINRAMPVIIRTAVLGSVFFTGTLLFGLGLAKWAESLIATAGFGFILIGFILLLSASIYLAITSKPAGK